MENFPDHFECISDKYQEQEGKYEGKLDIDPMLQLFNASCALDFHMNRLSEILKLQEFYETIFHRLEVVFFNQSQLVECIVKDLFNIKLHERFAFLGWMKMNVRKIMKNAKIYIEVSKINCEREIYG